MPLEPGRTVGHYRIIAAIGAGGMGEVYRATDTRLGRDIAIKVLPAHVIEDAERLARFRREAHLLASLNHPNIAAIYGFEEAEGKPFLALELVDGEDLAGRLAKGPIRLDEAMEIARQIAEGLEEAHEKGIVHRDLKPANVKVTPEGKVKILDFGLAKACEGAGPEHGTADDLSQSPTLTRHAGTQVGVILGTAAYMSPEQARGKAVDRRADIWAFGVVLYEMLTGKRLFGGETVSDVIAAVLTRNADLSVLPADTRPALRRLLARCLERDPKRRLRDVGEARFILQESLSGTPDTDVPKAPAQAPQRHGSRPVWRAAAAAAILLLTLAAGLVLGGRWGSDRTAPVPAPPIRFSLDPPPEVDQIWAPALSADGSFVVYEGHVRGKPSLLVHHFAEFAPRPLKGTEGARGPFLSPDGRWVAFVQGSSLKKTAISGGDVLTICEIPARSFPGAVWRPDGTILFPLSWLTGLWTVSAEGGEPQPLTEPDRERGEKGHWWPKLLPDGRSALFTVWRARTGMNDSVVALIDLGSRRYRTLFPGADARFLPPDQIVYYHAGAYHAVPFDVATLEVSGDAVPVLDETADLDPAGDQDLPLAVADSGTLVYTTTQIVPESRLAWVAPGQGPVFLPFPTRRYVGMDLSPDGRTLAAAILEAGRYEIRLLDLQRGTEQLLDLTGSNWTPRWDPQGSGIVFQSMRKGDFDIYRIDAGGGGREEPVVIGEQDEVPYAWSRDGRQLIFSKSEPEGSDQIWALTIGGDAEPQVVVSGSIRAADLSGDGHWLAYASNRSGRSEIYVQPFPGPGATTRISLEGGSSPRWSNDGTELFFVRDDSVLALSFRIDGGRFVPRSERVVLEAPMAALSDPVISPDGRRFLVRLRLADPEPPRLRVVFNWNREVGQKAPRP